jgi:GNAT superfamily N-acetyltransferase
MIEIKKATEMDCEEIFRFIRLLAQYEKLENEVTTSVTELKKALFGTDSSTEIFIGYIGNSAVCFALIFTNFSTFLGKPGIYLEDLFVKEAYRGKGYGKKMLQYLARLAVERNCGRLEWAVLDWNKPAITFYKSIGAKAMDDWTVYRLSGESLHRLADQDL